MIDKSNKSFTAVTINIQMKLQIMVVLMVVIQQQ